MSALPKNMAQSYENAAQPSRKDADLIRFPANEIIRRRQYAEQMRLWQAWKSENPGKEEQTGSTLPKMQHQPR